MAQPPSRGAPPSPTWQVRRALPVERCHRARVLRPQVRPRRRRLPVAARGRARAASVAPATDAEAAPPSHAAPGGPRRRCR
eukprot:2800927-Prymnesium_polylepis.1